MRITSRFILLSFIIVFVSGNYTNVLGEEKSKIAVMNLQGMNVSAMDAAVVSEFLRNELYNTGKYIVLERRNMEQVLKEQAFQQTGCTSQECAVKAGKLLNVKNVVLGSVSRLENTYFINIRLIDIEEGKVVDVADEETKTLVEMKEAVKRISAKLSGSEYQHRLEDSTPALPLKKIEQPFLSRMTGVTKKSIKHRLYVNLSSNVNGYSTYAGAGYIYNINEKYGLNLQTGSNTDCGEPMTMFGGVYKEKILLRIGWEEHEYSTIISPGYIFKLSKSERWFIIVEAIIPIEDFDIEYLKIGGGIGYNFLK